MFLAPNLKYKTSLCRSSIQNRPCEKGDYCFFAHDLSQIRNIEQNQSEIEQRNQSNCKIQHAVNYKTVFCKFFKKGQCQLETKCTFAHDKRELRSRALNEASIVKSSSLLPFDDKVPLAEVQPVETTPIEQPKEVMFQLPAHPIYYHYYMYLQEKEQLRIAECMQPNSSSRQPRKDVKPNQEENLDPTRH